MNKIDKKIIKYIERAMTIHLLAWGNDNKDCFTSVIEIAKMIQEQEDNEKYWKEYKYEACNR